MRREFLIILITIATVVFSGCICLGPGCKFPSGTPGSHTPVLPIPYCKGHAYPLDIGGGLIQAWCYDNIYEYCGVAQPASFEKCVCTLMARDEFAVNKYCEGTQKCYDSLGKPGKDFLAYLLECEKFGSRKQFCDEVVNYYDELGIFPTHEDPYKVFYPSHKVEVNSTYPMLEAFTKINSKGIEHSVLLYTFRNNCEGYNSILMKYANSSDCLFSTGDIFCANNSKCYSICSDWEMGMCSQYDFDSIFLYETECLGNNKTMEEVIASVCDYFAEKLIEKQKTLEVENIISPPDYYKKVYSPQKGYHDYDLEYLCDDFCRQCKGKTEKSNEICSDSEETLSILSLIHI